MPAVAWGFGIPSHADFPSAASSRRGEWQTEVRLPSRNHFFSPFTSTISSDDTGLTILASRAIS